MSKGVVILTRSATRNACVFFCDWVKDISQKGKTVFQNLFVSLQNILQNLHLCK